MREPLNKLPKELRYFVALAKKPRTKRAFMKMLNISATTYGILQREAAKYEWAVGPTGQTRTIPARGTRRQKTVPPHGLLQTERQHQSNERDQREHDKTRLETRANFARAYQADHRLSDEAFDAEQRYKTARQIVRGDTSPITVGPNDAGLKLNAHPLDEEELAIALAPLLRQHPERPSGR
jgi:hypothetical protein